jgi:hypothetical protein
MPEVNIMQATASACRPAVEPVSLLDTRACPRLMQFVFNEFLVNHKVDKVLLAASWKDEDIAALSGTLEALKARGIDVTVLGPIVEYDSALPRLLAEEILRNSPSIARAIGRCAGWSRPRARLTFRSTIQSAARAAATNSRPAIFRCSSTRAISRPRDPWK